MEYAALAGNRADHFDVRKPFLTSATIMAILAAIIGSAGLFSTIAKAADAQISAAADSIAVYHRSIEIDGVNIAYREAGEPTSPTVLLLHGFPTSSQMFRNLIPSLAKRYHVLAPDYPGYGASDMPAREEFEYSFANFANIVEAFVDKKGLSSYALYLMDYGAPVGYRLFAKNPERVTALRTEKR